MATIYRQLGLILLLGWGLRLYALNDRWLDRDEAYIYSNILNEPLNTWIVTEYDIGSHMLSQLLSKLAMSMFGDTLFSLRWFEAVLGWLTIALLYRLVTWLAGRKVARIAALLLAISPYAIYYAHTFRAYSSMMFYVLLAYYAAMRALQTRQPRYWVGVACALALAVYNHQYSALAASGILWLLLIYFQANPPIAWRHVAWGVTAAMSGPLLALAPIALRVMFNLGRNSEITAFSKSDSGLIAVEIPDVPASFWTVLSWFSGVQLEWKEVNPAPYLVYFLIGLIGLGVILALKRRQAQGALLLLAWLITPLLIYIIASYFSPTLWARPKHFGYTLPFFITLIALAIVELQYYLPKPLTVGLTLLIAGLWLPTLTGLQAREITVWSQVATYLQTHMQPTDIVICQSYQHDWQDKAAICLRNLNYGLHQKNVYPVISLGEAVTYRERMGSQPNGVWLVVTDLPPELALSAPLIWRTSTVTTMILPPPPHSTVLVAVNQHLTDLGQLPQAEKMKLSEIIP